MQTRFGIGKENPDHKIEKINLKNQESLYWLPSKKKKINLQWCRPQLFNEEERLISKAPSNWAMECLILKSLSPSLSLSTDSSLILFYTKKIKKIPTRISNKMSEIESQTADVCPNRPSISTDSLLDQENEENPNENQ